MIICPNCGLHLSSEAVMCPACGRAIIPTAHVSPRDRRTATLLCFFLGVLGAHRFYVGKTGTALLQLCTLGGVGIWWFIDFLTLIRGRFMDAEGRLLN